MGGDIDGVEGCELRQIIRRTHERKKHTSRCCMTGRNAGEAVS
jgi:hypothetical protein